MGPERRLRFRIAAVLAAVLRRIASCLDVGGLDDVRADERSCPSLQSTGQLEAVDVDGGRGVLTTRVDDIDRGLDEAGESQQQAWEVLRVGPGSQEPSG